jgi:hypothetical protein
VLVWQVDRLTQVTPLCTLPGEGSFGARVDPVWTAEGGGRLGSGQALPVLAAGIAAVVS